MRDVLLERVRPLVDRLAKDLAALAVERIEAELTRMGEAFSVARWPTSRIAAETQRAEASKHEGELPEPRSTFALGGE